MVNVRVPKALRAMVNVRVRKVVRAMVNVRVPKALRAMVNVRVRKVRFAMAKEGPVLTVVHETVIVPVRKKSVKPDPDRIF
jgi:hypothetical protein